MIVSTVESYSRTARMSSPWRILYSLPFNLISVPSYWLARTRSPFLTSNGTFLPLSSVLPLPSATTMLSIGFSLAVSGMTMRPFLPLLSFSATASTRIRSPTGLTLSVIICFPSLFDLTVSSLRANAHSAGRPLRGNRLGLRCPECFAAQWPAGTQLCAVPIHLISAGRARAGFHKMQIGPLPRIGFKSLPKILRRVADPVEAFVFKFDQKAPTPPLLDGHRDSLGKRPGLFDHLNQRPAQELQSMHRRMRQLSLIQSRFPRVVSMASRSNEADTVFCAHRIGRLLLSFIY